MTTQHVPKFIQIAAAPPEPGSDTTDLYGLDVNGRVWWFHCDDEGSGWSLLTNELIP